MKIITHNLHDNIYRTSLCILICPDTTEWDKWLDNIKYSGERIQHKHSDGAYYRILAEDNGDGLNTNIIFLCRKNFSILSHELIHFIFRTFTEKGIPLRVENDEAFAYYLEFWINLVREEWKRL